MKITEKNLNLLVEDHEKLYQENISLRRKLCREERENGKIEKIYKKLIDKYKKLIDKLEEKNVNLISRHKEIEDILAEQLRFIVRNSDNKKIMDGLRLELFKEKEV